jgi:hypothetical protein
VDALAKVKSMYETVVEELEEYKSEFTGLKNQDVTIRRLEDTIEKLKALPHSSLIKMCSFIFCATSGSET